MNINEVIKGWTFEETVKTAENLMEAEKNLFKWDVIRHLRDFAETYREQLKEYQQLEEQGRMIIFPCNKGDKIYEFYRECVECRLEAGETPEDIISMRRIRYFGYDGDEACIYASQALPVRLFNNDEPFCIPVSEIGKTVFLSYEEAEAKLKELKKELRGGENER